MTTINIKNLSKSTYQILIGIAKANRRSLQEQVKLILEKEAQLISESSLTMAAVWRNKLNNRSLLDTVELIREDRER